MNLPIVPNKLKRTMQAGQNAIGTMVVEIRQPVVMQLLANAGFDFVIIDNEHGPFSPETIADLSRTAKLLGLTPVVRIPEVTYPHVAQTLDGGAQGLMLPRIRTADEVRAAVQMMKYPPLGLRGNAMSRGHTEFLSAPIAEALPAINNETLLIVQIETAESVENIDEILTVPGVYCALVGPNDLAISLGIPGQFTSPLLEEKIEQVIAACQKHGVAPSIHINKLELAQQWIKRGMQIISSTAETGLMMQAGRNLTGALRATFAE